MSKMKKVLLMCTAYVLVAALAIGGTVAYLTSEDSDVNVMTLGNVSIAQHEYERVVDANGNYTTIDVDGVNSYKLKEFTQGKPLLPAVGNPNGGYDSTEVRLAQLGHNSRGGMSVLPIANIQDKFVVVENDGITDAYVRTIVAFEAGELTYNEAYTYIMYTYHFTWEESFVPTLVEIEGNNYYVVEFLYKGYQDIQHPNGLLKAGDYTYNSLGQVYMSAEATNEICQKVDGNGNGTLDILVLSQAVQAAGFADAKTALDTAFGKSSEKAAEWFDGIAIPEMVQGDIVSSSTGYGYSVANGESVVFDDVDITTSGGGINIQGTAVFNSGSVVNDSTSTNPRHMFYVAARENVANGHLTINDGEFTFSPSNLTRKGYYICADGEGAVVIVNGGTFGKPSTRDNYKAGIGELNGGEVIIKGGTFGFDPTNWVADGYEAVQNGNTWTVVAK